MGARKKTSFSKLVKNQLDKSTSKQEESNITPLVKSLSGVISKKAIDKRKKDYVKVLKKKYR